MITEDRIKLMAEFQMLIDVNIARNLQSATYANVAEAYAEKKLNEYKQQVSDAHTSEKECTLQNVVGQSEQLCCPSCKSGNTRKKGTNYHVCNICGQTWAT